MLALMMMSDVTYCHMCSTSFTNGVLVGSPVVHSGTQTVGWLYLPDGPRTGTFF